MEYIAAISAGIGIIGEVRDTLNPPDPWVEATGFTFNQLALTVAAAGLLAYAVSR